MSPPGHNQLDNEDQLEIILRTLGHPDATDLSFITYPDQIGYTLALSPNQPKSSFSEKYIYSDKELIQILTNMLEFNPYYRPTAK